MKANAQEEGFAPKMQVFSDTPTQPTAAMSQGNPYSPENFAQIRVTDTWRKYDGFLTWGKGQCLALLDDGCDLTVPEWRTERPWGKKVLATYNSIDGNDDPTPVPPGYHGTSVGYPSSLDHEGVRGVAYNNFVAQVRCVTVVHLTQDESATMAAALQWVADHHQAYHITSVNLSPLDDQRHSVPVPTVMDEKLLALRRLGIWVSGPCGNHDYTDGISWPACQPHCFAIGATRPGQHAVHLDRFSNTDLLVAAAATSSSNAYAAACAMTLREAIEKSGYSWPKDGETLPDAMMAIFQRTGGAIHDPGTGLDFRELDLLAAVDHVLASNL
ncbi:MAG: hypothetical protein V1800_18885 [Candidatus Latescibacterota bacterium]